MARRARIFYGWIVVAGVFTILAVTAGLGFYNASVILSQAVEELEVSTGSVSLATGVFFGVSGLCGFLLSRRMETVDLRLFYLGGGVVGAVALYGLRWVDSVAALYVFFVVFGISFALAGLVPSTTIVTRWFSRRRSVALSVASTGLSMGGILITPLAARLIADRDLAGAGPILAVAWLVGIIPVTLLAIRSRPSDKGLQPDNDPTPASPRPVAGASFALASRTRFFRGMCAAYALIFLAQVGAMAHLFNLVRERVDTGTAATAISVLAGTSVIGRLAGGLVVLRMPSKTLTAGLTLLQAFALVWISLADSRAVLLVGASIFGLSVGNLLMLQPLLLAEAFGVREYSRIYSLNQLFGTVGVAGGPAVLGALHDLADYRAAFVTAAVANVVGFAALLASGPLQAAKATWTDPGRAGTAGAAAAGSPEPAMSAGVAPTAPGPLPGEVPRQDRGPDA
jgi:MFS family permease